MFFVTKMRLLVSLNLLSSRLVTNLIKFKYVLTYGRDAELTAQARKDRFISLEGDNLIILSYDTLLRYYDSHAPFRKDILPDILSKEKDYLF